MTRNNFKIFIAMGLIFLSACSQAAEQPATPTTIAQADTPTATIVPTTAAPISTATDTPPPTSTPTPEPPTSTPTDTSTPTNTPMPPLDPRQVFVEYYPVKEGNIIKVEDGTIWQLDGDTVKKVLDFKTEEVMIGNWNKELTGWEIVGGNRKGETLFSDGSVSETISATILIDEGCQPGSRLGIYIGGFCEFSPDMTEKIFDENGDIFSMDLINGKKTNWSKNGFFQGKDIPMFVGWLDKDHILLSTNWDFDLTTFVLGRDGTLAEVSTLNGFGLKIFNDHPPMVDDLGYTRYAYKRNEDTWEIVRLYADKPWKSLIEAEEIKNYDGLPLDSKYQVFLVPTGFALLNEETDNVQMLDVPSELLLWQESFDLAHWYGRLDDFSLTLKSRDEKFLLLSYDGDAGRADDNGWGGIWLVDFNIQQTQRLNEHLVQEVFWLDKDTFLFTVNYTINNVPAPDIGTWLQKIGSEPVKVDTYRATSATMIPDTKEVLFVAKGTLYKYDGNEVKPLTEEGEFYDGTFVWPQHSK